MMTGLRLDGWVRDFKELTHYWETPFPVVSQEDEILTLQLMRGRTVIGKFSFNARAVRGFGVF